jgi:hypothetical protein
VLMPILLKLSTPQLIAQESSAYCRSERMTSNPSALHMIHIELVDFFFNFLEVTSDVMRHICVISRTSLRPL